MSSLITGQLDRRFLLTALMPVLALAAWLGQLYVLTPSFSATWQRQTVTGRTVLVTLLVIGAVLAATLLGAFRQTVLRLFAGSWPGSIDRTLGELGRRHHRRRALQMMANRQDPAIYARLRDTYPPTTAGTDVLATTLGNVLSAAESYPWERYQIDAAVVWPRLYPLLPAELKATLAAARADLDLLASCALFAIAGSVAGGLARGMAGAPWWQFLLSFWGPAAVVGLFYKGAIRAADGAGSLVRVSFDLHRHELLRQLDLLPDKPLTGEAERELWADLAQFWHRGIPLGTRIEPEPPKPVAGPGSATPTGLGSLIPLSAWLTLTFLVVGGISVAVGA